MAFIPPADVLEGFNKIKSFCTKKCPEFISFSFLDYLEKYYIGEFDIKTNTRKWLYFPVSTLNLNYRVKNKKTRTNNKGERFNQKIQIDSGDHHLSTVRMVDAWRLEQAHTESVIAKIEIGVEQPPIKLKVELDKSYANVLKNYKSNEMFSFMGQISNIIKILMKN